MRDQILDEIRRLAASNSGRPPGRRLFESETGIRESAWFGVYWSRWGDALSEAGFTPTAPNERLDEEHVLMQLAEACRHFGRVPATMELRMYKRLDATFPNEKTILAAFGGKANLVRRLGEWVRARAGYEDVAAMVPESAASEAEPKTAPVEGFV